MAGRVCFHYLKPGIARTAVRCHRSLQPRRMQHVADLHYVLHAAGRIARASIDRGMGVSLLPPSPSPMCFHDACIRGTQQLASRTCVLCLGTCSKQESLAAQHPQSECAPFEPLSCRHSIPKSKSALQVTFPARVQPMRRDCSHMS